MGDLDNNNKKIIDQIEAILLLCFPEILPKMNGASRMEHSQLGYNFTS